ncbi:hypothetical protein [Paenibacillus sp. FSL R7-0333]|uniref:hypothetical protein n=1 Tax=Paenibacillus sp. FSL R7-0333 TaxID=1926587 RepID=UPI00096F2A1E|nr:hypothetical protein BK146_17740 [Paenibacillus sp. FSL R7-0333]
MQANHDPRYPAPVQFYFTTECGRIFQWAAVDYESLILRIHEKGYRAKEIRTLEEQEELEASIAMGRAYIERELKEPA